MVEHSELEEMFYWLYTGCKIRTIFLSSFIVQMIFELSGLVQWVIPHGACSSAWPPSWWRTFSEQTSLPVLTQLHSVRLCSVDVIKQKTVPAPPLFLWVAVGHHEASLQSPILWAEKPSDSSCFSYVLTSRSFTVFVALLYSLSSSFMFFSYCSNQNCTQKSRFGCTVQRRVGKSLPSSSCHCCS